MTWASHRPSPKLSRANGCWVFKGGDRRYDVYKGNSIVADRLTAREVEQMAYGERGPDGRADSGEGPTSLGHNAMAT